MSSKDFFWPGDGATIQGYRKLGPRNFISTALNLIFHFLCKTYYSDKWDDWGLDLPPLLMYDHFFLFSEIIDSGAKLEWERQTIHLFLHLQCHVLDRENFCSTSNRSNSTAKSRPTPNFLSGKNNDFQDVLPPPAIHFWSWPWTQ